ncbi:hypothetical protein DFS34DRAFT_8018 [Phlyctochytrium arcticum]|nr:hypothetical protein DFS34DRAFT_8018 [Phlyctochytrium arcticum]
MLRIWRSAFVLGALLVLSNPDSCVGSTEKDHSNYGDIHKAAEAGREHFGNIAKKPTLKNQEEEDLYYFFTLHDFDRDSHLDGHELRTAFTGIGEIPKKEHQLTKKDIEEMIDHALLEDDTDGDGKVSWEEYLTSQLYHKEVQG